MDSKSLTVTHADLSRVLNLLGRTLASRQASSSPSNTMVITVSPNSATLETTDGETHIRATIPVMVDFNHKFFLPGRYFADIVAKLNDGDITLTFDIDRNDMVLSWRSTEVSINGWPPAPIPDEVAATDGLSFVVQEQDLRDALMRVSTATATDETRPVLTGILFEINNSQLSLVATDGFRLSYDRCPITTQDDINTKIILPSRAAALITHGLTSSKNEITVTLREKTAVFHLNDIYFSTTLLSGTFPNYEQVIPNAMPLSFSCSRKDITAAIDRASTVSVDSNSAVTLSFSNNVLQVSARHSERGKITETTSYEGTEEELSIAFNSRLLLPGLKACSTDTIIIDAINSTQMIRMRNNDQSPFFYIALPLRQAT